MRGAVLAGGAASRYGGVPKGLLEVGGERMFDRVVDTMTWVLKQKPLLVANAPDASTWRPELDTIADVRAGYGTLGGIYTAVTAGDGPVLCTAWDMPFLTGPLLRSLVDLFETGEYDAVLPESSSRRGLEPLCAVYGPACGPAIDRRLTAGELMAVSFHPDVRVGILSLARVREFGNLEQLFFNVNTPADLKRAEALWRQRA